MENKKKWTDKEEERILNDPAIDRIFKSFYGYARYREYDMKENIYISLISNGWLPPEK